MKTKINIENIATLIFVIAISSNIAFSQGNNWKLTGNNNVNGTDFIGTTIDEDFRIRTNNLLRMTILKNGNVRIENNLRVLGRVKIGPNSLTVGGIVAGGPDLITSTSGLLGIGGDPNFNEIRLGVGIQPVAGDFTLRLAGDGINTNGGILSEGTLGTGPTVPGFALFPRTLFFWYPRKAAIRAGHVVTTQWDDGNIGDFSAAFGESTTASGSHSFAAGVNTTASGGFSVAFGRNTKALQVMDFATGLNTEASGSASTAMGNGTIASGAISFAIGDSSIASEFVSTAMGKKTIASGLFSTAIGFHTTASGTNSTAMGFRTIASGQKTTSIGANVRALANNSVVIGVGLSNNPIINNSPNSLMVGFNSDVPSLFVERSDGTSGSLGKIGIGTTNTVFSLTLAGNGINTNGGIWAEGGTVSGIGPIVPTSNKIRMFWYPRKGAFRAGFANGTKWDDVNIGDFSTAFGDRTIALGDVSFAIGKLSEARGAVSIAMGNFAIANQSNSVAIGNNITAQSVNSFVMGNGTGSGIINNIENSLMIGFNSDIPTFFVGPSAGAGTTGNVKIGGTGTFQAPTEKLEVAGKTKTTDLQVTSGSGNIGDILTSVDALGNVTWAAPTAVPDGDWDLTTFPNDMIAQPTGNVGVGQFTAAPTAKLDVLRTLTTPPVANSTALNIVNEDLSSLVKIFRISFGLKSEATGLNLDNIGGLFTSQNAFNRNIGAQFIITNKTTTATNIGAIFVASDAPTGKNIAIQVLAGAVQKPGGGSWNTLSDQQLKTDITPFTDGLNVTKQINSVNYRYNGKAGTPTDRAYIGLIGQDLLQLAPYVVDTFYAKLDSADLTETALLSTNTGPLLFVAINAINELDSIKVSKVEFDSLKAIVTQCCSNQLSKPAGNEDNGYQELKEEFAQMKSILIAYGLYSDPKNVKLQVNEQRVILNQNDPNPFKESTIIRYFIPDNVNNAQLMIYDLTGKFIKEVPIEKGFGSIEVFASDLSSGIYSYSIVADGEVIDKKKMVLTK
ncbi:MAG: T9SS type A sorting domain-containing protein [Cytophagales bacterium]|nr:T9SS type A sorting domain-containing protein [Cytophagales bacterium]